MTVRELANLEDFTALCIPAPEREICGAYVGDLLSWVMGKAESKNVWVTIMSNVNTIAVASLTDVSCIVLAEGVRLDDDVLMVANDKCINVIMSNLSAYDISLRLSVLGI